MLSSNNQGERKANNGVGTLQSRKQQQQAQRQQQQSTLQIYARLRVIMPWESDTLSTTVKEGHTTVINRSRKGHNAYEFNRVFLPTDNNQRVFKYCCKPLLNRVLQGFNSIFIAYGQTGSGKTYSVLGKRHSIVSSKKKDSTKKNVAGVLALSVKYLLKQECVTKLQISAVETYGFHVQKVQLYDLGLFISCLFLFYFN